MTKWEYRTYDLEKDFRLPDAAQMRQAIDDGLAELGAEGWELAGELHLTGEFRPFTLLAFKRPVSGL